MMNDITLGQYFPGETVIHKLDPRTKILAVLVYIVVTFCISGFLGYLLLALFIGMCVMISEIPPRFVIKGLKPILVFVVVTALFNLFLTSGTVVWQFGIIKITYEGIRFAAYMVLRLLFLVLGTSLLTLTTSPISLTDGMESLLSPFERIGLPARELAMMMSIALRFIPILMEETDKIMKAQSARGADFESGNIFRRAKAMIPILIPLFISAFRRADELATAMECRCYGVAKERTSLHKLKYEKRDLFAAGTMVLLTAAVVTLNIAFPV